MLTRHPSFLDRHEVDRLVSIDDLDLDKPRQQFAVLFWRRSCKSWPFKHMLAWKRGRGQWRLGTLPVLRILKVEPKRATTLTDYREELTPSPFPLPMCVSTSSLPFSIVCLVGKRGEGGVGGESLTCDPIDLFPSYSQQAG
jgi:hypothetical protein